MAKKYIISEIEGKKLKLTNLDKILYPSLGVMKAQLVQYYIEVAKYMLPFVHGRPMTLIRYPDGVNTNRFYSKNRPTWTPQWVGSVQVAPDDDNIYNMANDAASLAWMANLATLELHPMTIKAQHLGKPDHFIFDLDPSDNITFEAIKELAADLKIHLEKYGYVPYLKTSGGKGLHLYVPIKPIYEQAEVIGAVTKIAKAYIAENPHTTLRMSKERRKGKILLDIYRNSKSQTCVAPYSTRGKIGCPISTPLKWSELEGLSSSAEYNIFTIQERLKEVGDVWSGFYKDHKPLHTDKSIPSSPKLTSYDKKRDFKTTTEPDASLSADYVPQSRYVVQIHDASNLHYDLRLEDDGVLLSWAVPKGMPTEKGIKRLAIQTEPHPIKYLTFEGVIPKEEYGGGEMWVYDTGTYEIAKRESKKIQFSLNGKYKGEYRIFKTKDKQWILELVDGGIQIDEIEISPMLASAGKNIPSREKYFFEIKWDGIRVVIVKDKELVKIYSRNGNELTEKFPKIAAAAGDIEAEYVVADGEIVALEKGGVPNFSKTVGRMHLTGKDQIRRAASRTPSTLYLFDCLYLDGQDIRAEPIEKRRAWLRVNMKVSTHLRYSDAFDDGKALFEAVEAQGMEGIMCKLRGSKYKSKARSKDWLKIKVSNTDVAYVVGYTEGKGDRQGAFGSMQLAKKDPEGWVYKGRVGTGFSQKLLKEIYAKLSAVKPSKKLFKTAVDEESRSTWIAPAYKVEVKFASLTPNGTYREPVFLNMKKVKKP